MTPNQKRTQTYERTRAEKTCPNCKRQSAVSIIAVDDGWRWRECRFCKWRESEDRATGERQAFYPAVARVRA